MVKVTNPPFNWRTTGADPGGGGGPPPPPKIGKNMIFWLKIVIFQTKNPKIFRPSLRNLKKYDFLASNRDFSHEIPKRISRLPPLDRFFLSAPPPPLT